MDVRESWALKNWCFWTVVLEKTLERPLDCKETQPVYPKGNQSWILIGRTDAEAETPIFWPPDAKNWLTGKDPDAGKDWRYMEKGMTEDEMVGWHHWLNGPEFEQTLEDVEGQISLACYSLWDHKELDTTEQLNNKLPSLIVSAFSVVSLRIHLTKLRSIKKSIVIFFLFFYSVANSVLVILPPWQ